MHPARKKALLLAGCFYLLLVAACNSPAGRKWQRVFLDGVPPEPRPTAALAVPAAGGNPAPTELPPGQSPDLAARKMVVHKPYANHECTSCHESLFSQKLVSEVDALCQLCHKSVFAQAKFRHAPAESGACLACHNPHQSTEKALLNLPGRQLCLECHEERFLAQTVEHENTGQTACHVCHSPHGGEQRFFLKQGWQAAARAQPPGAP